MYTPPARPPTFSCMILCHAMPCHACVVSHIQFSVTPWTVAHQVFLSVGFPRQEYWSSLPSSSPGALPDRRIKPTSLVSSALAGGFLATMPLGKPWDIVQLIYYVHFLFPLIRIWTSWEKWFLSATASGPSRCSTNCMLTLNIPSRSIWTAMFWGVPSSCHLGWSKIVICTLFKK